MNNTAASTRLSLVAVCIVIAGILASHLSLPRLKYQHYTQELTFDVTSYYLYLPMTFIYDDPGMKNKATIDTIFARYSPSPTFYQAFELENGNRVPNYTCGFAYAYAPFFFLAHFYAKHSHYLADGFSFPYQFFVGSGVLLYIFLGWFFLRKLLLKYFPDRIVALTMLLVCFGTNYFSEAVNNYLQPHAMEFSAYCILVYCIASWHERPKMKYMIAGGLLMGWMVLSRPSEIVCLLIPLLWNVYDRDSLKRKLQLINAHRSHILMLVLCGFLVFVPQFLYWKKVTGDFLFFSYKNTEGFDFGGVHIPQVLFSFKKSLFVYTPILIFPLIGMFLLRKRMKFLFTAVAAYALLNFYLLSSWAAWWNGGSFGMRYFTESYALMTIPFGVVLQEIIQRKLWLRLLSSIVIVFFVILNLFQTWQFFNWIIPDDRMTYEYYKRIFFKIHVTDEDKKYQEVQRSMSDTETFSNEQEYDHFTLAYYDFDSINATVINPNVLDTSVYLSPPHSCKLNPDNLYYPTYRIRYDNLVPAWRDHVWLRVSLNYFSVVPIKDNPASLVINMPHKKYNLKYRAFDFEKFPSDSGKWNRLQFDYMTPFPYKTSDSFEIYVWYRGKSSLYIDNLKVDVYTKK